MGARLLVLPLMIKQRRNLTRMTNHAPTVQRIQDKIQTAKALGDIVESIVLISGLLLIITFLKNLHIH